MKPFNLEAAIAGEKVITRDGREVFQFCYFKNMDTAYPVFASYRNDYGIDVTSSFTSDGMYTVRGESPNDLFMAPKTVELWANLYKNLDGSNSVGIPYETKEKAYCNRIIDPYCKFLQTVKITIEE